MRIGFAVLACLLLSAVYASAEPVVVRDCESCPELVVIPAGGTFVMGAEKAEGQAWDMPELMALQEQPVAAIAIARSYAVLRAALRSLGGQGRVLGRFSRVVEAGDTPAHTCGNSWLGFRFSRGALRELRSNVNCLKRVNFAM